MLAVMYRIIGTAIRAMAAKVSRAALHLDDKALIHDVRCDVLDRGCISVGMGVGLKDSKWGLQFAFSFSVSQSMSCIIVISMLLWPEHKKTSPKSTSDTVTLPRCCA